LLAQGGDLACPVVDRVKIQPGAVVGDEGRADFDDEAFGVGEVGISCSIRVWLFVQAWSSKRFGLQSGLRDYATSALEARLPPGRFPGEGSIFSSASWMA
jgi:hypothetical protein